MEFSEHRCAGCMRVYTAEESVCPHCGCDAGEQNPSEYLPIGLTLAGRYTVGRVLSYSGTTACYIAYDQTGDCPVYLREFMPDGLCFREEAGFLSQKEGAEGAFHELCCEFEQQGRMLAKLRDLSLMLPVYDLFKQNGTAYTVSEYLRNYTLTDHLTQMGGQLTWNEARKLFLPFLSSLISCHTAGLTHLGICPQNLLLDEDNRLRLIGFDLRAARSQGSDAFAPQLAEGYAAPEQYLADGEADARSDVYAVAATLFRTLTGNPPPAGDNRSGECDDLFMPANVVSVLPESVTETLADALQPRPELRISTLSELRDRLSTGMVVSALAQEAAAMSAPETDKKMPKNSTGKKYAIILIVLLSLILVGVGVVIAFELNHKKLPAEASAVSLPVATTATGTQTEATATAAAGPISFAPDLSAGDVDYYALPIDGGQRVSDVYPVTVIGYQYSDSVPAGYIVAQTPVAGAPVPDGATISVYLSAGKAVVGVPDVKGWKAEHAKIYLESLGFRVEIAKGADSSVDVGCVFGTWPDAGTEPLNGNKVTLRVNDQPATTAAETEPAVEEESDADVAEEE